MLGLGVGGRLQFDLMVVFCDGLVMAAASDLAVPDLFAVISWFDSGSVFCCFPRRSSDVPGLTELTPGSALRRPGGWLTAAVDVPVLVEAMRFMVGGPGPC